MSREGPSYVPAEGPGFLISAHPRMEVMIIAASTTSDKPMETILSLPIFSLLVSVRVVGLSVLGHNFQVRCRTSEKGCRSRPFQPVDPAYLLINFESTSTISIQDMIYLMILPPNLLQPHRGSPFKVVHSSISETESPVIDFI
jgi:hypothetical protein